ncbi:hypothetical protein KKH3_19670 [Pectobacterium actinidiae]|nr:hypothetical protein KKH3_19670 [Pectobacterium actinidiae]
MMWEWGELEPMNRFYRVPTQELRWDNECDNITGENNDTHHN